MKVLFSLAGARLLEPSDPDFSLWWRVHNLLSGALMTPNQITMARVAAAFAAVALFTLFNHSVLADVAAILLTVAAIALDGLDGYVARTRGLATPLGAQLDILGDRVVENLFFTFFAVSGLISLWVPVLFFVRGTLTDFLRSLAARAGRTGFGRTGMVVTGTPANPTNRAGHGQPGSVVISRERPAASAVHASRAMIVMPQRMPQAAWLVLCDKRSYKEKGGS